MKDNKLNNIKSTGFKTPDTYFETLEDAIFSKLKEETMTAKLTASGFKAPEDYFKTFDAKVLTRIEENQTTKAIPVFTWRNLAYVSGIAASVILAINIFFTHSNKLTFDDLETASIESYLINEDLNAYDIAPYLGASELNSDDFIENTINASEIEDYLLQNSDVEHLITD